MTIALDVFCGECTSLIDSFTDTIAVAYPFWCEHCQARTTGPYPWYIRTRIDND